MNFTPEQEKAINFPEDKRADSASAVVSAAAGSGKTTLLVERVIRILSNSDENKKIDADKLAILTFTTNSANEFRTRMTASIAKKAKEEPDNAYIKEQLIKFRSSVISTINAFCLSILKDNAEAFELPVNFSIVDEAKASVLRNEAIEATRKYFYSPDFDKDCGQGASDLLFKTFSFQNDYQLFASVENIYDKTSSLVDPEGFMSMAIDNFSTLDKMKDAFIKDYISGIEKKLNNAQMHLDRIKSYIQNNVKTDTDFTDTSSLDDLVAADQKLIDNGKSALNTLKTSLTIDNLTACVASCKAPFSTFSKKAFDKTKPNVVEKLEKIGNIRDKKIKPCFKDITEYTVDEPTLKEERSLLEKTVSSFVQLVKRFKTEYSNAKLKAGYVDFNDCERLLLNKLTSDDDFRSSISQRYACIIIDEFQDTSDLQYEIFKMISNDENNIVVVGDIKQSIYAFRGGNPRLMLGLIKDNQKFETLPLNKNFRSRENVIDTVNDMFTGLMTEKHGDVDYNSDTCLYYGADYYKDLGSDNKSQLHLLDYQNFKEAKDFDKDEEEAKYTAELINKMINKDKFQVSDQNSKSGSRDCTPKDFAILLRASTHAQKYKKALNDLGIAANINGASDYFGNEEINLILNMLKIIDDPMRDEEMLNVIMSPVYMMDAEEVAEAKLGLLGLDTESINEDDLDEVMDALRRSYKYRTLYNCLSKCSKDKEEYTYTLKDPNNGEEVTKTVVLERKVNQKCKDIIRHLEIFRAFKSNCSIERLIRKVYDDTDFLAVIATYEQNDQKLANIRLMLRYAADFEANGGGTLSDFLRYIDRVRKNEKSFDDAKTGAAAEDSVKIMTFHASKGLEMPIVILGQLGKGENRMDTTGTIIFNRNTGLALKNVDIKNRYSYPPFAYTAIANAEKTKQCGEELRLLYVAMTRAKEKLIMIGQIKKEDCVPLMNSNFSAEEALSNGESIKWIISSLTRNAYANNRHIDIIEVDDKIEIEDNAENGTDADVQAEEKEEVAVAKYDKDAAKRIAQAIQTEYANSSQTTARSKYTVTEIAHMIDEQESEENAEKDKKSRPAIAYISKPSFLTKSQITGKEVGDAYHHAMEHFPLDALKSGNVTADKDYVAVIIKKLNEDLKLEDKEVKHIKPERIAEFFNSMLGQRMLKSQKIEREYKIFAEVKASDIYVPDEESTTIVQGRADMFFYEDDGIVLVDYKSDSNANLIKEFEAYRKQLSIYKTILPLMTGVKVKEIYIYSFSEGKEYLV